MKKHLRLVGWLLTSVGLLAFHSALAETPNPGVKISYPDERLPGTATAIVEGDLRTLKNDLVSFQFDVTDGRVKNARFDIAGETGATVVVDELFALMVDGVPVNASAMKLDAEIRQGTIPANPASPDWAIIIQPKLLR